MDLAQRQTDRTRCITPALSEETAAQKVITVRHIDNQYTNMYRLKGKDFT